MTLELQIVFKIVHILKSHDIIRHMLGMFLEPFLKDVFVVLYII